ncbi:MAG: discoidin domain-containing protein [Oscillospiraceae bacterium]|nr:discoidin domain-containing protein [Oscillospiraceae bacterium]
MKKRICLFLAFCIVISLASAITASAWTGGPAIASVGATTDDYDYEGELAFDNDPEQFWHSQWRADPDDEDEYVALDDFPQTLIVELDNTYWIDCVGYLPRPDASRNGSALEAEIWVSTTGTVTDFDNDSGWTKVASATWDEDHWLDFKEAWDDTEAVVFSNVEFDPVEAKLVKFKIVDGMGGWACCAALELGFLGVGYTPMEGFVPKSAPGTPAPAVEEPEPAQEEPAAAAAPEAAPEPAAPVPEPAPTAPQTGDGADIVIFSIMLLAALCLVSYKTIIVKIN